MAQEEDDLIFAMSVMNRPSALVQRTPVTERNPNTPVIKSNPVVSHHFLKPAAETAAIQIPQPQELKLPSPEDVDNRPPRVKPPASVSVDCKNVHDSSSSGKTKPMLSSSANSIFTGREPPIRTVGFEAPSLPSSPSNGPKTLK